MGFVFQEVTLIPTYVKLCDTVANVYKKKKVNILKILYASLKSKGC